MYKMVNKKYLAASIVSFLTWMAFDIIDVKIKWVFIGFGTVMLLFGIFTSPKKGTKVEDLNKKEGNNYDI